jgi:hypothetical protein
MRFSMQHYECALQGEVPATEMCLRVLKKRARLLGLFPETGKQSAFALHIAGDANAEPMEIIFVSPTRREDEPLRDVSPPRTIVPDVRRDYESPAIDATVVPTPACPMCHCASGAGIGNTAFPRVSGVAKYTCELTATNPAFAGLSPAFRRGRVLCATSMASPETRATCRRSCRDRNRHVASASSSSSTRARTHHRRGSRSTKVRSPALRPGQSQSRWRD